MSIVTCFAVGDWLFFIFPEMKNNKSSKSCRSCQRIRGLIESNHYIHSIQAGQWANGSKLINSEVYS
jgi:uncharacterized protein (DUF1810 family)